MASSWFGRGRSGGNEGSLVGEDDEEEADDALVGGDGGAVRNPMRRLGRRRGYRHQRVARSDPDDDGEEDDSSSGEEEQFMAASSGGVSGGRGGRDSPGDAEMVELGLGSTSLGTDTGGNGVVGGNKGAGKTASSRSASSARVFDSSRWRGKENTWVTWIDRWATQMMLLSAKNVLVLYRKPMSLLALLFMPLLCLTIFLDGADELESSSVHVHVKPMRVENVSECFAHNQHECVKLVYNSVNNDIKVVMKQFARSNGLSWGSDVLQFADKASMKEYVATHLGTVEYAVMFDGSTGPSEELTYRLYYNASMRPNTTRDKSASMDFEMLVLQKELETSLMGAMIGSPGAHVDFTVDYGRFAAAKDITIDVKSNNDDDGTNSNIDDDAVSSVDSICVADKKHIGSVKSTGTWAVLFPLAVSCAILFQVLVDERTSKLVTSLRRLGVMESTYWMSWMLVIMVVLALNSMIGAGISRYYASHILENTDFGPLFALLFMYQAAVTADYMFLSTLCSKQSITTACMFVTFLAMGVTLAIMQGTVSHYGFVTDGDEGVCGCTGDGYTKIYTDLSQLAQFIAFWMPWFFAGGIIQDILSVTRVKGEVYTMSEMHRTYFYDSADSQLTAFDTVPEVPPASFFVRMLAIQICMYMVIACTLGTILGTGDSDGRGSMSALLPQFVRQYFSGGDRVVYEGDTRGLELQQSAEDKSVRAYKVSKTYDQTTALKEVSLTMRKGEVFALLGHNGAGKSTLINVLSGVTVPTHGKVFAFGLDVEVDQSILQQYLGVCPQHDVHFPELTAREHLILYAGLKGLSLGSQLQDAVSVVLERVGLTERENQMSQFYSGGMKRRLSVAMACVGDCSLIFFDEPTTGLDPVSKRQVWDMVNWVKEDRVVVLTTHNMEEADALGDTICFLHGGRVKAIGDSLALKQTFGRGFQVTLTVDAAHMFTVREAVATLLPGAQLEETPLGAWKDTQVVRLGEDPSRAGGHASGADMSGSASTPESNPQTFQQQLQQQQRAQLISQRRRSQSQDEPTLVGNYAVAEAEEAAGRGMARVKGPVDETAERVLVTLSVKQQAVQGLPRFFNWVTMHVTDEEEDMASFLGLDDADTATLSSTSDAGESFQEPQNGGAVATAQATRRASLRQQLAIPACLREDMNRFIFEWGLSNTTLEQVFLKLCAKHNEQLEADNDGAPQRTLCVLCQQRDATTVILRTNRGVRFRLDEVLCAGCAQSPPDFALLDRPEDQHNETDEEASNAKNDEEMQLAGESTPFQDTNTTSRSVPANSLATGAAALALFAADAEFEQVVEYNDNEDDAPVSFLGGIAGGGGGADEGADERKEDREHLLEVKTCASDRSPDILTGKTEAAVADAAAAAAAGVMGASTDASARLRWTSARSDNDSDAAVASMAAEGEYHPSCPDELRLKVQHRLSEHTSATFFMAQMVAVMRNDSQLQGRQKKANCCLLACLVMLFSVFWLLGVVVAYAAGGDDDGLAAGGLSECPGGYYLDDYWGCDPDGVSNFVFSVGTVELNHVFLPFARSSYFGASGALVGMFRDWGIWATPNFVRHNRWERASSGLYDVDAIPSEALFTDDTYGLDANEILQGNALQAQKEWKSSHYHDAFPGCSQAFFSPTGSMLPNVSAAQGEFSKYFADAAFECAGADGEGCTDRVGQFNGTLWIATAAPEFNTYPNQYVNYNALQGEPAFEDDGIEALLGPDCPRDVSSYGSTYAISEKLSIPQLQYTSMTMLNVLSNTALYRPGRSNTTKSQVSIVGRVAAFGDIAFEYLADDDGSDGVRSASISIIIMIYLLLVTAFWPMSVWRLAMERSSGLTVMMKTVGLQPAAYILGNYLYDLLILVVLRGTMFAFAVQQNLAKFNGSGTVAGLIATMVGAHQLAAFSLFFVRILGSSSRLASTLSVLLVVGCSVGSLVLFTSFPLENEWPWIFSMVPLLAESRAMYSAQYNSGSMGQDYHDALTIMSVTGTLFLVLELFLEAAGIDLDQLPAMLRTQLNRAVHPLLEEYDAVHGRDRDVAVEKTRMEHATAEGPTSAMRSYAVALRNFWFAYPATKGSAPFLAVQGLSMGLEFGECYGLLGPNGAGKSTTMSVLSGLLAPGGGDVFVGGYDVTETKLPIYKLCGFCPQFDVVWPQLTVAEHLVFQARVRGVPRRRISAEVQRVAAAVELDGDAFRSLASGLSGGMMRRLSIGLSIVGDPPILFLDEPTTGLDPATRQSVWEIIEKLKSPNRLILITTHSMAEAEALCTRIGIMGRGKLCALGTSNHLKSRFGEGFTLLVNAVSESDLAGVHDFVARVIARDHPGLQLVSAVSRTRKYVIPREATTVAHVFDAMEKHKRAVGIREWGINMTSLEEVFISVAKRADEEEATHDAVASELRRVL